LEFDRQEYDDRVSRAKVLMAEYDLDAIMVTGDFSAATNYRYFSGHNPRDYQLNFARPHVCVITASGDAALLVYYLNTENAADASWITDVREYTQPFPGSAVTSILKDLGLTSGRIGCELGLEQRLMMPVEEFLTVRDSLPRASFVDASALIWDLRTIKSPAEVECIRRADEINHFALKRGLSGLREGATEDEVVTTIFTEMIERGASRPPFAQLLSTTTANFRDGGPGHRARFGGPSHVPLESGDLVFVDSGCVINGYWGEFNRMGVVGHPTERQERFHGMVRELVTRTINDMLRPGVTGRQVMEFLLDMYREFGLDESQYRRYREYPFAHLCHGIGLTSSEPPLVRIDSDEPLRAGMVISVEAYVLDEIMYGSEEDVLITADGAEVLSPIDTGLFTTDDVAEDLVARHR
jgi:Xaa-Pro dipeptidase